MADQNIVRVEQDGDIAVIIVNNPPVNTITAAVRAGLDAALSRLASLSGVRAVLLRCEGSTFFSGADIGEFNGPPKEAEYREIFGRLEALSVPVVAAMHGTVLGGGSRYACLPLPDCGPWHPLRASGSHTRNHPRWRRYAAHAALDRDREDS